jgi:bacteriorhodopsin
MELWYSVVMFIFLCVYMYLSPRWKIPSRFRVLHYTIVSWSAFVYLLIHAGYGNDLRYFDWVVTTPLLLLALYFTADLTKKQKPVLMLALLILQMVTIMFGALAERVHILFYGVGVITVLGVLYIIWGPLRVKGKYNVLLKYFTVMWTAYPVVYILSPLGFAVFTDRIIDMLFIILSIFSKGVFGIIDMYLIRRH